MRIKFETSDRAGLEGVVRYLQLLEIVPLLRQSAKQGMLALQAAIMALAAR